MNWKQRALYQLMSDISEKCYCAGWMNGNECRLWRAITDPDDDLLYGQGHITNEERDDLRTISDEIGGWIVWDVGPKFVTFDEWAEIRQGVQ